RRLRRPLHQPCVEFPLLLPDAGVPVSTRDHAARTRDAKPGVIWRDAPSNNRNISRRADPAAAADSVVAVGGARTALRADRSSADRLDAGGVRHPAAAGEEPGPLLRIQLARLRLPRRRRLGRRAALLLRSRIPGGADRGGTGARE